LERRRSKLFGKELAGVKIYEAALVRGGRRSGECGRRMKVTASDGYL
jgi:hypothetical protein